MLEVACRRCDYRGRLRITRLIEQRGADMRLTELRYILAGECPRVIPNIGGQLCGKVLLLGTFPGQLLTIRKLPKK